MVRGFEARPLPIKISDDRTARPGRATNAYDAAADLV
jgi:hypothetical protein